MYAYIKGTLIETSTHSVVIETNGIGYFVMIPINAFGQLPQIGERVTLYTAYIVREQSQALYGFCHTRERDLFELLLGVSGIGPKLALSLIGHSSLMDLYEAIHARDLAYLCKIPGIGRKTAERLSIELKDKLADFIPETHVSLVMQKPRDPHTAKIQDAMSALINLGYNQAIAQKAIKKSLQELSEDVPLAFLITASLKNV